MSSSTTLATSSSSSSWPNDTSPETVRLDELASREMSENKDELETVEVAKSALKEHLMRVLKLSRATNSLRRVPKDATATKSPSSRFRSTVSQMMRQQVLSLMSQELRNAKVTVIPKPSDTNQSVSQDPRRGVYTTKRDYGGPSSHLCKLIRRRLITKIVKRHFEKSTNTAKCINDVQAKRPISSGKSRRRRLEKWRLARARRLEARVRAQRRRRREQQRKSRSSAKVLNQLRRKVSKAKLLLVRCEICKDLHVRHTPCPVLIRDLRMANLVKQLEHEAEDIEQSLNSAWQLLEGLEFAYHDIIFKIHRIQADKVCLKLLTGQDFPGDNHPYSCPCDEDAFNLRETLEEHERLAEMAEMEREEERRRMRRKRDEEKRIRERRNIRREKLIELRKRKFYRALHDQDQEGETGAEVQEVIEERLPSLPVLPRPQTLVSSLSLAPLTTLESASFALMRRQRLQTLDDDMELNTNNRLRAPLRLLNTTDDRVSGLARLLKNVRKRNEDKKREKKEEEGAKENKMEMVELVEEGGKLEEKDLRVDTNQPVPECLFEVD